jgi:hypothetical protein
VKIKKKKTKKRILKMSDNELEDDIIEPTVKKIESKRIFMNHVDSFNGKNISTVKNKQSHNQISTIF